MTILTSKIIKLLTPEQRKDLHVHTQEEAVAMATQKDEKAFQRQCDNWLQEHGYWPRSEAWMLGPDKPPRGWRCHMHLPHRNFYMLDNLLLANDGRWFEFELKTPTGRWSSREQQALCEVHGMPVCRTLEEVITAVRQWEADNEDA